MAHAKYAPVILNNIFLQSDHAIKLSQRVEAMEQGYSSHYQETVFNR